MKVLFMIAVASFLLIASRASFRCAPQCIMPGELLEVGVPGTKAWALIDREAAPTQQNPRPVVRSTSPGVLVDVTVLDKDGSPAMDLKAEDFEIAEDGRRQQIVSATLMRAGVPARISDAKETGIVGAPAVAVSSTSAEPTNRPPVPTITAILFNALSPDARPLAARAAGVFVHSLAAKNEFAGVFLAGTGLATIQPFTNQASDLLAAINHVAMTAPNDLSVEAQRSRTSVRTQGLDPLTPVTAGADYAQGWTTIAEREQRLYKEDPRDSEQYLNRIALRMEDGYSQFLSEYEGDSSLTGLRSTVAALSPLPGRKSILYFTEELPITSRLKSGFEALISQANVANITIYSVDAAGLRVHSMEQGTAHGVNMAGAQGVGDANRGDGAYTKDLERQSEALSSHAATALSRLANDTGGFLIDNTNDLSKGVARMQVERTTYYLLGYQPTNQALDGKFRKVSVKVKRGKYTVRARPGYVATAQPQ